MNETIRKNKRGTVALLVITTLVFFAVLGILLLLHRQLPVIREKQLTQAIERGDITRARSLAHKLDDEEKQAAYLTECDYWDALALMKEERWEEAAALFTAASAYYDAPEQKKACEYQIAVGFSGDERWEEAEARFLSLGNYQDSADQALACRFRRAVMLEENRQFSDAAAVYLSLGDYPEAQERLYTMAQAETGIHDPETAVAVLLGQTPEESARLAELRIRRGELPRGIIAVGFYHTVGLCPDGSVLACGDDSYGQCRVAAFKNIRAVAAGGYHSLLLHSDGTVSAVGRNSEGQCDTSSWTDVVQIAAADYASFGLRSDGTVLYTGYNNYDRCKDWNHVVQISAGSYNIAALREDGGIWLYPSQDGAEELHGLVALGLNTGFCFGLLEDGSLIGNAPVPEGWSDILCLSASSTRLLALRSDGTVLCHSFRAQDSLDCSELSDVVALAAGATHCAFVLRDGRVRVLGDLSHEEGNTASWQLAVNP